MQLYVPFLLLGLAFGPRMTLGMVIGMAVAGLQLAFSSGLSGTVWNSARSEIFLGRAKDE
jgi:Na+/H+-translocating membrane pyrophosphatase